MTHSVQKGTQMTITDDPIATARDLLPMPQLRTEISRDEPSTCGARPFGLRFLESVDLATAVDLTGLTYDDDTQLAVDAGVPWIDRIGHQATQTPYTTREDHQTWPDKREDRPSPRGR